MWSMMPAASALAAGDGLAAGAHLERHPGAAQPGQPLGASGTGNDPEHDFRLTHFRVPGRDPEVARLRDLESASERVAVDGRNERLGRVLDVLEQRVRAS